MQACPELPVWAALVLGQSGAGRPAARGHARRRPRRPRWRGRRPQAAERAAERFHAEGREVWIAHPPAPATTSTTCCCGRADAVRAGGRGGGRMAARHRPTRPPTADARARHAPAARSSTAPTSPLPRCAPTMATSPGSPIAPGACCSPRTRRPGSTAAAAGRPGSSATTTAARCRAHDRGPPAARAGPAGRLAQARPERRPGAGLPAAGAPEERPRHARSGAAGAGRHRHRAGVRQRRHADHRAGLSPGDPAALRAGTRLRAAAGPGPDAATDRGRAIAAARRPARRVPVRRRGRARARWRSALCPSCGR